LTVVEDACQASGATIDGRPAGTWGDVGVLSFGGSKLLTAGRGGALFTRHADASQRIKIYCERGNDAFALCELQAAVLVPQLQRLEERNRKRRENVERILAATASYSVLRPLRNRASVDPSFYKLAWLLAGEQQSTINRENFLSAAQAQRIPLDAGFRGFALRSSRRCRVAGELNHSAAAAAQTVVLHHPVLLASDEKLAGMIEQFVRVLEPSH